MRKDLVNINDSKPDRQLEFFNNLSKTTSEYNKYLDRLPKNKLERIKRSVGAIKSGVHASAPLICMGPEKCPFVKRCPIPELTAVGELIFGDLENYPIGRECVMEKFYVEQKIVDYLKYLDVDPTNPIEMSIVNELALIDLYKNRCLLVLSQGDKKGDGRDFLQTDVTGFNENGDRAETTKLHPIIDMIDKLERRRERWLEKLMETRKSKADFMMKIGENNNNSKVLQEISQLREALYAVSDPGNTQEILLDEE
jgi:hypothetical protein